MTTSKKPSTITSAVAEPAASMPDKQNAPDHSTGGEAPQAPPADVSPADTLSPSIPPQDAGQTTGTASSTPVVSPEAPEHLLPVPDFGQELTAEERDQWLDATAGVLGASNALQSRTDIALYQGVAMILLLTQVQPSEFFAAKLKEAGLRSPASKSVFAPAVAHFFNLDVKHMNKHRARNDSKKLHRLCTALQQLLNRAPRSEGRADMPLSIGYNEEGVRQLVAIIKAEGGINALALAEDIGDDDGEDDGGPEIRLDASALRDLQRHLAVNHLLAAAGSDGTAEFALAIRKGSDTAIAQVLELPAALKDLIWGVLAVGEVRVQTLGEMLHVGKVVKELPTTVLVNRDDDPADPKSRRRFATRQFVISPDGEAVTIGPILSDASIVVEVVPVERLLDTPMGSLGIAHTVGRKRAEVNISHPKRRVAFTSEIGSTAGTQGLTRVVIKTTVAKDEADNEKDVGFLIERPRGEMPLVRDQRAKPQATAVIGQAAWRGLISDHAAKLRKLKKLVTIQVEIKAASVTFTDERAPFDVDVTTVSGTAAGKIRTDDFLHMAEVMEEVPTRGPVEISIGEGLVSFSMKTELAEYRIFLPVALRDGSRSTRDLTRLTVPLPASDKAA